MYHKEAFAPSPLRDLKKPVIRSVLYFPRYACYATRIIHDEGERMRHQSSITTTKNMRSRTRYRCRTRIDNLRSRVRAGYAFAALFALTALFACETGSLPRSEQNTNTSTQPRKAKPALSPLERALLAQGLTDVRALDPAIACNIRYATTNNFVGVNMYGALTNCYLAQPAAMKLVRAHRALQREHPGYRFLVYDAVRPVEAQVAMYLAVRGTPYAKYVASPHKKSGSTHSYGAAVDLTIIDEEGAALDMGTAFDSFARASQPRHEDACLADGTLTEEQVANRRLLRRVMTNAGFLYIKNEWWHFEEYRRREVAKHYDIVFLSETLSNALAPVFE